MKNRIPRFLSIFLAFLLLASTTSFTVAKHYCGDFLVDVSIFGSAKSCALQLEASASTQDVQILKMSCCSDVQEVLEGQDELKLQFDTFHLEPFSGVNDTEWLSRNLFDNHRSVVFGFDIYPPPLITRDYTILYASFLI